MSYTLTIICGCTVYVSRHPDTCIPHTRIIERRGAVCRERKHEVGVKLRLSDLLPGSAGSISSPDPLPRRVMLSGPSALRPHELSLVRR
jgi:hypothetical protein